MLIFTLQGIPYSLTAGDVFITPPDQRHGAIHQTMPACEIRWCQIAPKRAGVFPDTISLRSWRDSHSIDSTMAAILNECRSPTQHTSELMNALCTLLLINFQRSALQAKEPHSPIEYPACLPQIHSRSEREPWWWPSIGELTDWLGCGRTYLFTLSHKHWHCAPLVYLMQRRLAWCRDALLDTNQSITALAHHTDFRAANTRNMLQTRLWHEPVCLPPRTHGCRYHFVSAVDKQRDGVNAVVDVEGLVLISRATKRQRSRR